MMKYSNKPGVFTTNQFSVAETITETDDVILIAKDIIKKINNVSDDVKKELNVAIKNLDQASNYLEHIRHKTDIALKFVPKDVQDKECL